MEEKINLLEYGYSPDQKVEIQILGDQLLGLMHILSAIVEQERHLVYLDAYPGISTPNFIEHEGEKVIESVDVEWRPYPNANSFYSQVPTTALTDLGARAMDLLRPIQIMHRDLITDGTAKKQTDL